MDSSTEVKAATKKPSTTLSARGSSIVAHCSGTFICNGIIYLLVKEDRVALCLKLLDTISKILLPRCRHTESTMVKSFQAQQQDKQAAEISFPQ